MQQCFLLNFLSLCLTATTTIALAAPDKADTWICPQSGKDRIQTSIASYEKSLVAQSLKSNKLHIITHDFVNSIS